MARGFTGVAEGFVGEYQRQMSYRSGDEYYYLPRRKT